MSIQHRCEKCKYEINKDVCYCEDCLEEEKQKVYNAGYDEARKEFEKKE